MKCLNCKKENEDIVVYCQRCGAYLPVEKSKEYFTILKAFLLGTTITGGFYLLFLPVTENYQLKDVFSGTISEIITGLTMWSLFIILFKYQEYRKQLKAFQQFRHKHINTILSQGIYVQNMEEKLGEISHFLQNQKIKQYQNMLIFRRVRRIFHYIKAIPKKEEINKIFDYQAQIDFNRMENSYSLLNVLIWAIPILGFIGTVSGIGESIAEFSGFIRAVSSVELGSQMRSALGGVTSGLSVAFNTTFLALVFVIPIMILSSFLRKAEEDMLLTMEEYCLEEVLPNLHIIPGAEVEQGQFDDHMHKIMQLSGNWMARLEPLIESMASYAESLKHQIEGVQPLVKDFSDSLFTAKDNFSKSSQPIPEKKEASLESTSPPPNQDETQEGMNEPQDRPDADQLKKDSA